MELAGYSAGEWLLLVQYELLLFAGLFFLFGALDELAMDLTWAWLKLRGRARTLRISPRKVERPLFGKAAILIPAWSEELVIATTVRHALSAWPQQEMRLFVGCYRNDAATIDCVLRASAGAHRVRLVVHEHDGPSTKADCLNRLYRAVEDEEVRMGERFRSIVLHDAEDMVDTAALGLLDAALERADFVQLPVPPEPQAHSRWIAGHHADEFAEAHGKAMGCATRSSGPALGRVGCAIAHEQLAMLAKRRGSVDCCRRQPDRGLRTRSRGRGAGRPMRFLRARHDGRLIATRACFPADIGSAVRQKTRWVHGIAFQGWDRIGWTSRRPP